jgi:adenine-specific DNA-methyltransferase
VTATNMQLHSDVADSVQLGLAPDRDTEHGEVFTRRWVVELILDLVGYTADRDLATLLAVEPACGTGAFLIPMVERLVDSCQRHGREVTDAAQAIRAFDLLEANVATARARVSAVLARADVDMSVRMDVAADWIRCEDFLLSEQDSDAVDIVVGNPPYVRLESISEERSAAYRRACPTMRGRSDLYVGFIETGLRALRSGGVLGFIVADRWMRNQYGAGLRRMIAKDFAVSTVIAMHDVDAFDEAVSAYPAVTIIRRAEQDALVVADTTEQFGSHAAAELSRWMKASTGSHASTGAFTASRLASWFPGDSLWPTGSPEQLALLAELEQRFPPLQDPRTGTRVGIGIATGADRVYLTKSADLVEPDRLLPLVMTHDTTTGQVKWSGTYLVNPWDEHGLVELDRFPRLREHLERHVVEVRRRYVARRDRTKWYRTIDRVQSGLRTKQKLLFPDLKAAIHPVLDDGEFYPHHNLYFVTSSSWPLEVLGGLLLSDIANLFVGAYCVRMRGGCYRFQAQYLRRIRVPVLEDLSTRDLDDLADAFTRRDRAAATDIALRLYAVGSSMSRVLHDGHR